MTKKARKKKAKTKRRLWSCHYCLAKYDPDEGHDCSPMTERQLLSALNEDLRDAFARLRSESTRFGEQRVYNNARAVMFAKKICYMFVRMKKSYLELCFFLPRQLRHGSIHRVQTMNGKKFCHTFKLVHSDQVEEPLTDWLREAFEVCP